MPWETPAAEATLPGRRSRAQATRARGHSIHRTFTGYAGACIQVWRVT